MTQSSLEQLKEKHICIHLFKHVQDLLHIAHNGYRLHKQEKETPANTNEYLFKMRTLYRQRLSDSHSVTPDLRIYELTSVTGHKQHFFYTTTSAKFM